MAFTMNNPFKHMGYKVKIQKGKVVSEEEKPHGKFKTETEHEEFHVTYPTEDLTEAEIKEASKPKNTIEIKKDE